MKHLLLVTAKGGVGISQPYESEDALREGIIKQEFHEQVLKQRSIVASQYVFVPVKED